MQIKLMLTELWPIAFYRTVFRMTRRRQEHRDSKAVNKELREKQQCGVQEGSEKKNSDLRREMGNCQEL